MRHCILENSSNILFIFANGPKMVFQKTPRPLSSLLLADPNLRLNLGSGPPFKGLIWGLYFDFFLTLKKLSIFLFIENNLKNNFYLSTNFMFFKTLRGVGGVSPPIAEIHSHVKYCLWSFHFLYNSPTTIFFFGS